MKVEIDFESLHKLSVGDCIEIHGIVGEKKLEIIFLIADQATFRCCLDHKFGWDIYIIDKTVSDINSGTIFTSLEYYPKNPFTVNFKILSEGISTTLNDKELCSERQCTSVSDITSIQIIGDSVLKHILFSDHTTTKSSRVLQPLIYQSLESKNEGLGNSVTVIESRQRIIFKHGTDDRNDDLFDSDSDEDFTETRDLHTEFDYLKKVLLAKKNSEIDDFSPHYPNDVPQNKYIISYFDPDQIDSANGECQNDEMKSPTKFPFYEGVKENMSQSTSRISLLRSNTERIEQSIVNTGRKIDQIRHPGVMVVVAVKEDTRPKKAKMLSIPISEMDGSYYKYNLSKDLSRASKIPILKSPKIDKQKPPPTPTTTTTGARSLLSPKPKIASPRIPKSPAKLLADRKQGQSHRRRHPQLSKN